MQSQGGRWQPMVRKLNGMKCDKYKCVKSVFFKCSHNDAEPWREIDLTKRGHHENLHEVTQPQLFDGQQSINPMKKDLISMWSLIPPVYHRFYQDLAVGKAARNDSIEGIDTSDFELEAE